MSPSGGLGQGGSQFGLSLRTRSTLESLDSPPLGLPLVSLEAGIRWGCSRPSLLEGTSPMEPALSPTQ